MFSSISRIFTGHTPSKHSSPGPQRPDVEESIDRTFPSTAPAEYPDGIDDRQLARMASQDWDRDTALNLPNGSDNDEAFDDEVPDGITDDYVDPFASMQPFSTQAVLDEDVTAPTYASSDDASVKKKKAKKGKKSDEKKTRTKKGKSKRKSSDLDQPGLPLPTPITSGPTSHSAAEEAMVIDGEAHDEQDAVAQQQKKRKRKARNENDSSEGQDPTRQKKKKRRAALEDIQDVDMDSQPEESVPESPVQPVANGMKVQSPAYQPDPAPDSTLKSEPQRSQLLGVSRQLFSKPSGTPALDASDDDNPVSMSSPSVAAQRRRSMSRGSQISVLRQNLAREAASQSAPSSQVAESSDEAPREHGESALESDAGSLADNLPPSSQPPREDTPSSDEEPQLPIRTFRDTWNDLNGKNAGNQKVSATPQKTTRRRAVEAGADISETGNLLSSAQKSSRSTASKRQRSKPDFFENPPQDKDAGKDQDDTGNRETVDTRNTEKNVAALTEPPSTEVAEPPKKQKKKTQKLASSRASTAANTATTKTKASKKAASLEAASRQAAGQFVTGQFSIDEMRTLTQAVEKYRDDHGLSQKEVNDLIQMKSYRRGREQSHQGVEHDNERFLAMWAEICAALPNRRRQKVIDVARQEFHNFAARGGGWNDQEDARLEELHTKYNGSWVKIAGEMNRHPNDVRDRYRNYVICGGIERWQKWTEEEERELVEHVVTSLRRIQRIPGNRDKEPLSLINWQSISELMGHRRSRLQCMRKFKKLNVEVGPRDVLQSSQAASRVTWALEKARKQIQEMPPEAKYELVSAILAGAAGRDKAIRWSKLVDVSFRRKWPRPTLKLLWHRLKQQVPGYEGKTVRDCARWLLEDAEANNPRDARFLDGGHADGDAEDESMVVDPPKRTVGRRANKPKNLSEEMVVDSDDSDDEETRLTGLDSPSAQQQPSSAAAASQRTTPFVVCSPEGSPRTSPSLPPAASQDKFRLAPTETGGVKPSPAKKRIRLSGGKSARQRSIEEDGGSPEPMASQYSAAEDIPDRLKEKKESARRRISSGSRLRSTASLQPESVQNSDVDEDMPPIHVPPSTQAVTRKRNMFKLSQGNWARKTGASVLPGEAIEPTESTNGHTAQGEIDTAASTPAAKPREAKRRRMNREVAESPA
ncbi:myb-like DNA-binding domain-containing protein [Colletotrichum navitas]|uniref:Myb-like DNA-binding domain-containing protein n=1 Tax=Colletotrichum navitas TaxID=681940 RepID=A0AAD8PSV3_9PEZI|nr:myb-like DNA-binding domain-containing protein [Colletotrichum navitas]KAK1579403.1 myb-like DNA-binding domain-containing protein [Colletotrichum navitas]